MKYVDIQKWSVRNVSEMVKDSANIEDLERLDDLINSRANEGWEFVTHSYMPNVIATRSAILVTFRKEK